MDDPELEVIRQRRMQELMSKHGAGNQQNGEQQKAQEDAKREAEERRQLMLSQILSAQARERQEPEERNVEAEFLAAVRLGNLELCKELGEELSKGRPGSAADVTDKLGRTSLHFAARGGNIDICKYLLGELEGNLHAMDQRGETPMTYAQREGHNEIMNYFCENGAAYDSHLMEMRNMKQKIIELEKEEESLNQQLKELMDKHYEVTEAFNETARELNLGIEEERADIMARITEEFS